MAITDAAGFTQYGSELFGATSFAQANPVFKEDFLPAVRNLVNSKRIAARFMRRNTEDIYGDRAVISLRTGRNEGMNSIDENASLPDPEGQVYDRAYYQMRFNYGRIKVSGPSVAASSSDRGSFINILTGEIEGLTEDIQHEFNRIHFGDGSGRLCRIVTTGTSLGGGTPITSDLPGGFTSNQGRGTQYLRNGMKVALISPNAASPGGPPSFAVAGGGQVTFWVVNVNHAADTFELSVTNPRITAPSIATLTVTASTTYYLVKASQGGLTTTPDEGELSFLKEPYGFAAIVGDTNPYPATDPAYVTTGDRAYFFGGIDADTEPTWQAYVIDNGGVPMAFDQDLLQQGLDGVDMWGDGVISLFITSFGIRRRYANSLIASRRYVNRMKLDGGFDAVEFDMRPLVADKDCTRGRIYGLDRDTIFQYYQTDWFWMDADGSILHRMPNSDAYQAALVKYCNNGTDARNRNLLIADVEDY